MQTDATLLANKSQHCWMLHVASICTPCCVLLGVVVQSLKLVKFLAMWKWIQQLPTMLHPFAPGYSFQELLSHATNLFRSPHMTIHIFCHFQTKFGYWIIIGQPYPDLFRSGLGSFSNDDGEGNEKITILSNWFRLAKQQPCTCITLFCIFLFRHWTTTWFSLLGFNSINIYQQSRIEQDGI